MRHATILVAILAFVPLTSATAQVPPPVKVGDRVRVTAPDVRRREGTVQLLTTDSLVMLRIRRAESTGHPPRLCNAPRIEYARGFAGR